MPLLTASRFPPFAASIIPPSDPAKMEYEEAVSKVTLQQIIRDLEPSTSYTFYVKAYTSHGASKPSESVSESTHGEGELKHIYFQSLYPTHIYKPSIHCIKQFAVDAACMGQ